MGYDIPEPFVWDNSFEVFYAKLDEQHKGLFKGLFDCAKDRGNAGCLKTLQDNVAAHFRFEEGMMQKANYGDFKAHEGLHHEFEATLNGLKTPLTDANLNFGKDWLVNHIKTIDFKYKGKL